MGAVFARALVPQRKAAARVPEHTVRLPSVTQDLDRYAEYARVCGFTLRDHVAPTWLHVLTFPLHMHLLGAKDSTVPLIGSVHVSNTMTLHRPVALHEPLNVAVRCDNLRPHRRGALVDLVGTIHVHDDLVWEGSSTYLASGAHVPGEPEESERAPFSVGTPQAQWRLPARLGQRYRKVSGDPNPIHVSKVAAKAFGFARPIIHGMWTHAHALAALDGRLPDAYTVSVDFVKPLFLPGKAGFRVSDAPGGWDGDVTDVTGTKALLRMRVRS